MLGIIPASQTPVLIPHTPGGEGHCFKPCYVCMVPVCLNVLGLRALRPISVFSPSTSCSSPQQCNPDPHLTSLPSLQPRPLPCSALTETRGRPRLAAGFPGQPVIWHSFKVCSALRPGRWYCGLGWGRRPLLDDCIAEVSSGILWGARLP